MRSGLWGLGSVGFGELCVIWSLEHNVNVVGQRFFGGWGLECWGEWTVRFCSARLRIQTFGEFSLVPLELPETAWGVTGGGML